MGQTDGHQTDALPLSVRCGKCYNTSANVSVPAAYCTATVRVHCVHLTLQNSIACGHLNQINDKNCSLSIVLTGMDQKLQKS